MHVRMYVCMYYVRTYQVPKMSLRLPQSASSFSTLLGTYMCVCARVWPWVLAASVAAAVVLLCLCPCVPLGGTTTLLPLAATAAVCSTCDCELLEWESDLVSEWESPPGPTTRQHDSILLRLCSIDRMLWSECRLCSVSWAFRRAVAIMTSIRASGSTTTTGSSLLLEEISSWFSSFFLSLPPPPPPPPLLCKHEGMDSGSPGQCFCCCCVELRCPPPCNCVARTSHSPHNKRRSLLSRAICCSRLPASPVALPPLQGGTGVLVLA